MTELLRALGALAGPPAAGHERLAELLGLGAPPAAADHADLFLFQLPPFASVYLGREGKLGGEARDRVAGFWRAVGQIPPPEPDHIGALLGLYAALCEAESAEGDEAQRKLLSQAATALLHEHLLPWTGPYLTRVQDLGAPFYAAWARLLLSALRAELEKRGAPQALPLHLRDAPSLPDPRARGGEAFLEGLLAPVCSGLILTRSDLARGAATARVAVRAGERRYALEAMMSQDAPAVLEWLGVEARSWIDRHEQLRPALGDPAARAWVGRAAAAAQLLDSLAQEAVEVTNCPG